MLPTWSVKVRICVFNKIVFVTSFTGVKLYSNTNFPSTEWKPWSHWTRHGGNSSLSSENGYHLSLLHMFWTIVFPQNENFIRFQIACCCVWNNNNNKNFQYEVARKVLSVLSASLWTTITFSNPNGFSGDKHRLNQHTFANRPAVDSIHKRRN